MEVKSHNRGFQYMELAGTRVRLRPTTTEDAATAFPLIHRREPILRWLIWGGPRTRQELAVTYTWRWPREMRQGLAYAFAIEELDRPGLIGCIDARVKEDSNRFEAGYWLAEEYWGRGYVSEALGLICYLCFQHLGAEVIHISAFAGNDASRRVQAKNGFVFEGTLRRMVAKDGRWIDLWHSSLLREEWERQHTLPTFEKLVPLVPKNGLAGWLSSLKERAHG
jgi:RimJ/RimL family protein N-acetyltransferase